MDGDATYVGLDIGETGLITGCARKDGSPTEPFVCSGNRTKHLRREMHTTLKRLQEHDAAECRIDERFDHYQNALTDIVEKASRQASEYARQFEHPVLVLEDLTYIRESLDYSEYMNHHLHSWAFPRLQGRIEHRATEAGIPVEYVNPAYTSQTCTRVTVSVGEKHRLSSNAPMKTATFRRFRLISTLPQISHDGLTRGERASRLTRRKVMTRLGMGAVVTPPRLTASRARHPRR
jgi:IS605 OrfB family transposase